MYSPSSMRDIPDQEKRDLFIQLAALEDAGVPVDRALTTVSGSAAKSVASRADVAARLVGRGKSIDKAGADAGLFNDLEARLLHGLIQAGSPADAYRRLAKYYERRVMHRREIQSKLLLPVLMFLAAIFIGPMPQLLLGKTSLSGYLSQTVSTLAYLLVFVYLVFRVPQWLRHGWLKLLNPGDWFDAMLINLPLMGTAEVRRCRTQFLRISCLLLQAGIAVFDVIPVAANSISNRHVRRDFKSILTHLQSGMTIGAALSQSRYFNAEATSVASTGEATGDVGQVICRYADLEEQGIEQFNRELVSWLPRLIYLIILIVLAWGIVGSATESLLPGGRTP